MKNREKYTLRSFFISTEGRNKAKFPHPSEFDFILPLSLTNIAGVAIRDFSFGKELLVNENNRALNLVIDGVSSTVLLTKGDYTITNLITELNTKLAAAGVQAAFSIDATTGKVILNFTAGSTSNYIAFSPNSLLKALGYTSGLVLYKTTVPSVSFPATEYQTSALAETGYNMTRASNMVIRINDVETIMADNPVTDRCTAVLLDTSGGQRSCKQCADHFIPLLQTQSRIQVLRIKLLNMDGDLYDTLNNDASFLIEFYCEQNSC